MNTALLSVSEAKEKLLSQIALVQPIEVDLFEARGRILAKPVAAPMNIPSFTNSSMDGYAVISKDTQPASQEHPVRLSVIGDIPAGRYPEEILQPGCCMRIMTGAALPKGADAVVPLEATDAYNEDANLAFPNQIHLTSPVNLNDYLRPEGSDIKQSDIVLNPGERLRPQEIGLLAMLGISQVAVYRPPRIALLSTGNELATINQSLQPGKIYDANSFSLGSLILQYGCELFNLGIAKDEIDDVQSRLDDAVDQDVDLIISSAGVSVGAFDYVRYVLTNYGKLAFWRINIRPGKPLAFGAYRGIPFVGLPGNPVSAFVGFEVFIRPALLKMSGVNSIERVRSRVQLAEPITSDGRESYLRAKVWQQEGRFLAKLAGHQGSGNLYSLVQSNAFLIVPSEVKSLPIGAEVEAWFFDPESFGYSC